MSDCTKTLIKKRKWERKLKRDNTKVQGTNKWVIAQIALLKIEIKKRKKERMQDNTKRQGTNKRVIAPRVLLKEMKRKREKKDVILRSKVQIKEGLHQKSSRKGKLKGIQYQKPDNYISLAWVWLWRAWAFCRMTPARSLLIPFSINVASVIFRLGTRSVHDW